MKYKSFRFLFALIALASGPAALANDWHEESDKSGDLKVDVVVDMTEAGKRIPHPTPEHPAYYLPLPAGNKDIVSSAAQLPET